LDLSIAIINWNTKDLLERCLSSIYRDSSSFDRELIVVDNGSSDGSLEMIKNKFSQVRLVENPTNLGYSRAANQAIASSRGRYILLLNSDTEIFPGALDSLCEFMESSPEVGATGPMLLNPDGSLQYSCRNFPSFGAATMHAFLGLISPENPYSKAYKLAEWNHNSQREVDWVSGAAIFLRRQALEEIGFFDEDYFMYLEDVDLCYRLWQAGWKVCYFPKARILHHIAQSSRLRSPKMIAEHHKSIYRFYAKHHRAGLFLKPIVALGLLIRGIFLIAADYFKRQVGSRNVRNS